MKNYQIDQTVSGVTIGQWAADSENGALNLMAQDAGYEDYDALLSTTGETRETHTLAISILDRF